MKIRHPNVEEETYVDIDLIFAFINTLGEGCSGHFTIPFKKEEFHEVLLFFFINTLGEGCSGHFTIPFKKEEFHEVLQRQIDFRLL